jgi:hypothetical protein
MTIKNKAVPFKLPLNKSKYPVRNPYIVPRVDWIEPGLGSAKANGR